MLAPFIQVFPDSRPNTHVVNRPKKDHFRVVTPIGMYFDGRNQTMQELAINFVDTCRADPTRKRFHNLMMEEGLSDISVQTVINFVKAFSPFSSWTMKQYKNAEYHRFYLYEDVIEKQPLVGLSHKKYLKDQLKRYTI